MIIPVPYTVYDSSTIIYTDSIPPTPQQPLPPHPTHTFNPDARYPILDLSARAEEEWDANLARASRMLPEAVREYHRRYAKAPPPGFDMVSSSHRSYHLPTLCPTSPLTHSLSLN
ncbi:hypothetical protein AZE42_04745 [Rhizopogon vesiculosus]|uniref:Uncharacterized protein n=1 Tax=Rhizopogon vesiculosus TaxID=180088 RepID=A0A1J8QJP7_9AGAM|nr:hypothetical protein AZE42_04745 [Rhizopogon vesiculosus]